MNRKVVLIFSVCLLITVCFTDSTTVVFGGNRTRVVYGLQKEKAKGLRAAAPEMRRSNEKKNAVTALMQADTNAGGGHGGSSNGRPWFSLLISVLMLGGGLLMTALLLRHMWLKAGWVWRPTYSSLAVVIIIGVAALAASSIWTPSKPGRAAAHTPEANPSYADNFTSSFSFGGNHTTQIAGADYDASGNLYVAGGFVGTLELTINNQPVTLTSNADYDFFVAKFDANNNCLWARMANGATGLPAGFSLDGALALAVDAQGNCYLGGGFVRALSFKDSNGATLTTLQDNNNDINFEPFVAKYDTNGALAWAKGGDSGASDDPEINDDLDQGINAITEIVVDKNGNPYIAGRAAGLKFLGTGIIVQGESDVVVARLNPADGAVNWVRLAGGKYSDGALGLTIDDAANVYVIGYFDEVASFPTTPPTELDSYGFEDTFVTKFTPQGQCQWVKQIGGTNDVIGSSIAVNGKGDLYLTGYFLDEAQFGSFKVNSPDYVSGFLVKWDTNCQYQWVRTFGHTADAFGDRVALDRLGNPFVQGTFFSEDLDPATAVFGREMPATQTTITTKDQDMYLAKYDGSGAFRWAKGVYASGSLSVTEFDSDEVPVSVLPLRIIQNRATNGMSLLGDFKGTLTLSDTPTAEIDPVNIRRAFAARLVHTCPPLAFSALPNARVNETYNAKITLTTGDNPAQFAVESVASLPPGLTLANDGTISGTPTQPGNYTIKVNGTDAYDCGGSNTYQLTVSTYEADVAPRQTGNGAVSVTDWTQVGRFIIGLDSVQASEFQRADCAPRNTQGDGQLTIGDWVQAGRYAVGLDTKAYAAGPTAASLAAGLFANRALLASPLSLPVQRILRAVQASEQANTVVIELDALGNENAFSVNLAFDPTAIRFVSAALDNGLPVGALLVNDRAVAQGNISVLLGLPMGQSLPTGARRLLKLQFEPISSQATTLLRCTNTTVADPAANAFSATAAQVELTLQARLTRSPRTSGTGRRTSTRSVSR